MVLTIIGFIIVGIIAGYLARLLVPGPDPMGFVGTVILGIIGSFVGGTLASLIFDEDFEFRASNIIGSIIGAIIALLIYRSVGSRTARSRR